MNFDAVPIIKIELENMRHSIMAHLGIVGSELSEILDKKIQEAIESYDFSGKVNAIVSTVITEAIEYCFRYGGGRQCINETVNDVLNQFFAKTKKNNEED